MKKGGGNLKYKYPAERSLIMTESLTRVTFGVHPSVYSKMHQGGGSVCCIEKDFAVFKCLLLDLIGKLLEYSRNEEANEDRELDIKRGCWVTIHELFTGIRPISFQMNYDIFETLYYWLEKKCEGRKA